MDVILEKCARSLRVNSPSRNVRANAEDAWTPVSAVTISFLREASPTKRVSRLLNSSLDREPRSFRSAEVLASCQISLSLSLSLSLSWCHCTTGATCLSSERSSPRDRARRRPFIAALSPTRNRVQVHRSGGPMPIWAFSNQFPPPIRPLGGEGEGAQLSVAQVRVKGKHVRASRYVTSPPGNANSFIFQSCLNENEKYSNQ